MFSEIMRYILDLGPTVMLPLVIIVFSKLLGMKLGDCFKSGLHIGIGFVGIGLVIGLMLDSIGPAAKAMAEHFQINLHVIDVGWPGSSPMTWASQIALVAIPVAIGVNVLMLVTRMTRVVNVDIWNIWHMTFTGAMLHLATGSYWLGILGVVVHAAFVYKLGDWFAKDTRDYFGLEGIAIPHGSSAYLGPVAVLVDTIIEKIPGLNRIHFSADDVQKRFGPFGEPVTVGFVMGLVIGVLAGYDAKAVLQLALVGTLHHDLTLTTRTFGLILRKELTLLGSWMNYSAPWPGEEWETAARLLAEKRLQLTPLIAHRGDAESFAEAVKALNGAPMQGKILLQLS
ncbi:hypothetical protein J9P36_000136 [Salmonella enterica]|nr:hypothetical protein [Salmonella enterica]